MYRILHPDRVFSDLGAVNKEIGAINPGCEVDNGNSSIIFHPREWLACKTDLLGPSSIEKYGVINCNFVSESQIQKNWRLWW